MDPYFIFLGVGFSISVEAVLFDTLRGKKERRTF